MLPSTKAAVNSIFIASNSLWWFCHDFLFKTLQIQIFQFFSYYAILYILLFNKFTFENQKIWKKQEARKIPISFITRHLGYIFTNTFTNTFSWTVENRNLLSLAAIIHIVCTKFLPRKQHFLPPDTRGTSMYYYYYHFIYSWRLSNV